MKREQKATAFNKLLTSVALVGAVAHWNASTFLGPGDIPWLLNTYPKKWMFGTRKEHFGRLIVRLCSCSLCSTWHNLLSCCGVSWPPMYISSLMLRVPGIPSRALATIFWNISEAQVMPKFSILYRHNPTWVLKVVR